MKFVNLNRNKSKNKTKMEDTSKKNSSFLYLVIILILMSLIAFLSYKWSNKKTELNNCMNKNLVLQSDIKGLNKMMEEYVENISTELKQEFNDMLVTYDALIAKDKSKESSINKQKSEIQSLLNQLNSNKKLSASDLYKFKKENETLREIMKSYVVQIDSLNTINIGLNTELEVKKTELISTTTERDEFKKVAEEKTALVTKGSKLQAYNFVSEALRMKLNNMTEITDKAKKAIQFRSSFTISENSLANTGKKIIYLQIIGPSGEVMQSKLNNTIETENGTVVYSDKKEIDYQNQSLDLTIYYNLQGGEAIKGNYKVKIFCEGNIIGTDGFTLK